MADETMNKKGELALRNIIFMIVVFSAVILLATLFVNDMATEYENENMSSEYNANSLASKLYGNVDKSIGNMSKNIDEAAGSFGTLTGIIGGVGTILKTVILAPLYVQDAFLTALDIMGVPSSISNIIVGAFYLILTAMIIFIIVSALSRGGTKL